MNKQQKQFNWQVKVLDEANHIIEMVGSTEDYDRVGDKMLMTGAKLQNYLKNPVILANHNYGDSERPTVIGRALSVVIQNSQLIFKIQFADTDNGREWFYLYSNGYMNASSIGFIPLKYKPNDQGGYDFKEWELLELSLVAVPCNPNAIQRAFEDGKISKAFFDAINKNNEEDIENMKVKDVQALIDKAVESKVGNIKKNYETEINDKTKEIEILSSKNKDLEVQLEQKAGATLSTKSKETLKDICEGLKSHAATLEKMLGDNDDPKYSEEDIQKAVQEKIEKALNGGK